MPECYDNVEVPAGYVAFALVGAREGKTITIRDKYRFQDGLIVYPAQGVTSGMKTVLSNLGAFLLGPDYEFHPRGISARGIVAGSGGVEAEEVEPSSEGEAADPNHTLRTALVEGLDPENDDHWTDAGIPKMAAVEIIYGSSDILRDHVDQVLPGFTRDAALELKTKSE